MKQRTQKQTSPKKNNQEQQKPKHKHATTQKKKSGLCYYLYWASLITTIVISLYAVKTYFSLASDQPYFLQTQHAAIVTPSHNSSRLRINEIHLQQTKSQLQKQNIPPLNFFQWWNFLVFDAETRDHFNIYYGIHHRKVTDETDIDNNNNGMSDIVPNRTVARVSIAHLRGSEHINSHLGQSFDLQDVSISNDFDLSFLDKDTQQEVHAYRAIGEHSYQAIGRLDTIEWNLIFHRVNGYYGARDQESNSTCVMLSTLWGYHSVVEGYVISHGKRYEITTDKRYRAYAAGSWGCKLPSGEPAIEHPWTWFWLIIPNQIPQLDIGMVAGTGRMQIPAVGSVEGGFMAAGLGGENVEAVAPLPNNYYNQADTNTDFSVNDIVADATKRHVSLRYVKLFHGSPLEMPLLGSSSDGYLSTFTVTQDQWTNFTDAYGVALIPLRQTFRFSSQHYAFVVDFHATTDQYFRAPVVHDGVVFSDFRAVGVRTHVVITRKTQPASTVFDGWVDTMNAVEYAYVAPLDHAAVIKALGQIW